MGTRLEELLEESGPTVEEVVAPVTDAETRRALRAADEEEDYLDEGAVIFYSCIVQYSALLLL